MAGEKVETTTGEPKKESKTSNTKERSQVAQLYRSDHDRILGGVAGGLADFFDVDATLIRIIFVLLTLFGGSGLLIYIILWVIVPSQSSTASGITRDFLQENINEIKDKTRGFADDFRTTARNRKTNSRSFLGIILLGLGALFLLQNLGIFRMYQLGRMWPLVLIVLGFALLARKTPRT